MEATSLAQQSTSIDCQPHPSTKMAKEENSLNVSRAREILDSMREKREAMSKRISGSRCPDSSCYPVEPPTRQNSRPKREGSSKPRDARLIIHSMREAREHLEKRVRQLPLVTDSCFSRSRSNRTKSTVLTCDDEEDKLDTSLNQSLASVAPSLAMTEASSYVCQNDDAIHKRESLLGSRDARAKLSTSRSKLNSHPILTLSDIELPREFNSMMRGKSEELSSSPFWNSITNSIHDDENSTMDELFVSCSSKLKLYDSCSRLPSWKEESAFQSILGSSASTNSSDDIPKVSNRSSMEFLEDHKQRQKQLATMIERVQKMKSEPIASLQLGQHSGVPVNPLMMMMDEEDELLDITSNSDTSGWFTSSGDESDLVYSQTEDDQENGEQEENEGANQVDDDMSELTFQWEYDPLEQNQAHIVGTENKAPEPPSSTPPPIIVTRSSQSEDSQETNEFEEMQAPASNQMRQRLQPNRRDKVTGGLYHIAEITGMVKTANINAPLPLVHLPVHRDLFVSESVADARCGAKGHVFMALQSTPVSHPDSGENSGAVEGEDDGNGDDGMNQQKDQSKEVQLNDLVHQSMPNKIGTTEILHESDQNVGGFMQSEYQGSAPCQFISFREALESCGKSQSSLSTISASVVSRDHNSDPGHQLSESTPSSKGTNPSGIPYESARETTETTNGRFPILNNLWKAAKALRSGTGSHLYIAQKTYVSPQQLEKTAQSFQNSPGRKRNTDNIIPVRVSDARCQASGGHSYLVSRTNIPLRYEV